MAQTLDALAADADALADDPELIDFDGWVEHTGNEPAPYTDPAEVIAIQAQQLANVRHALRSSTLTPAERFLLEEEQATLCCSIREEMNRAELLPEVGQ
jgi:hypothetical protein